MSSKRWVLRCKECRSECIYAEIRDEGVANYFFPKKPEMAENFTYTCPNCSHKDSYKRTDLVYQDDAVAPSSKVGKCS